MTQIVSLFPACRTGRTPPHWLIAASPSRCCCACRASTWASILSTCSRRRAGRRCGRAAGRRQHADALVAGHPVSRCARSRWLPAQVPGDDDRRRAVSAAPGHLAALEDSLLQRGHGGQTPIIAPKKPISSPTCRPCWARAPWTRCGSVQAVLGLDYAGIDFGLNPNGEILLFEANATMVVKHPDEVATGITGARPSTAFMLRCAIY